MNKIIELRHELHRHPELSGQEFWTKRRLMEFVKTNTNLQIVDNGAWFYAFFQPEIEDKPPIAFRADMDALPICEELNLSYASQCLGISHKCGHDGHSAALAALAVHLSKSADVLKRKVYLVFQPAEEIGMGGEACAGYLYEAGVSEVYAFHNLGGYPEKSIVIREGISQPASEGITIRFEGANSHAAYPEQGRNPSFVIGKLLSRVEEILKRKYDSMVLCTIVNISVGTKDFGISAGAGELSVTIRAEDEQRMHSIETELVEYAKELALAEGFEFAYEICDYFPETRNHAQCLQKVRDAAESLGCQLIEMNALWRASEDFGHYTKRIPGAIFYIGNGVDYAPLHTAEYDFNDNILEIAENMFFTICMI